MRQRAKVRRGHQDNQRQHRAHHDAPELDEPKEGIIWEHRVDKEADKGHHHRHREEFRPHNPDEALDAHPPLESRQKSTHGELA